MNNALIDHKSIIIYASITTKRQSNHPQFNSIIEIDYDSISDALDRMFTDYKEAEKIIVRIPKHFGTIYGIPAEIEVTDAR